MITDIETFYDNLAKKVFSFPMKFFCFSVTLFFLLASAVHADSTITKLYDSSLKLQGCAASQEGCKIQKLVKIERFVPESGYLGIFFQDKSQATGSFGGFDFSMVSFKGQSGVSQPLGAGGQVYEAGTLKITFDQPYNDEERIATNFQFIVYFLPHSAEEKNRFLLLKKNDAKKYDEEIRENAFQILPLCSAVSGEKNLPSPCESPSVAAPSESIGFSDSKITSDPFAFPELDFSAKPSRKPLITFRENFLQGFLGAPLTITVSSVVDPDGKCGIFQYEWQKSDSLVADLVSFDQRFGDLTFIPKNTGVFQFRLQVKEVCKDFGSLTSDDVFVAVVIKDKGKDFPDLKDAGPYQNAMLMLYSLGALKGYPDSSLKPNQPITRAEFLKLVFETLKYQIKKNTISPRFFDVLPGDWFAPYVSQADLLGVIKGYSDNTFKPHQTISLVEALKITMHFTILKVQETAGNDFADVKEEDWFGRYLETAYREGILDDINPGKKVFPHKAVSRGKAAQIIVRTFLFPVNRINQTNKDVLRRPETFVDFSAFKN